MGSRKWVFMLFFIGITAAICWIPITAWGLTLEPIGKARIGSGMWEVQPLLGGEYVYQSNIFQRKDAVIDPTLIEDSGEDKNDFVGTLGAALNLKLESDKYQIIFTNMGQASDYHNNPQMNHFDYYGNLAFVVATASGLTLKGWDGYSYTPTPPAQTFILRRTFYTNAVGANVSYKFADVYNLELSYQDTYRQYIEHDYADGAYHNNEGIASFYYKYSPMTAVTMRYKFEDQKFMGASDDDFTRQTINGGLTWEATGKLTGYLLAGYTEKVYQHSVSNRANTLSTLNVDVDLKERFSSHTTGGLLLSRVIDTEEANASQLSSTSTLYRNKGQLDIEHYMTSTTFIGAKVGLDLLQYQDLGLFYVNPGHSSETYKEKRKDTIQTYGADVGYNNKSWLKTVLDYTYTNDDSNIDYLSYDDHRVSLSVILAY